MENIDENHEEMDEHRGTIIEHHSEMMNFFRNSMKTIQKFEK